MIDRCPIRIVFRAVVPNPPPRRVYKLSTPRQAHYIEANFLLTTASDFFGIDEDAPKPGDCDWQPLC